MEEIFEQVFEKSHKEDALREGNRHDYDDLVNGPCGDDPKLAEKIADLLSEAINSLAKLGFSIQHIQVLNNLHDAIQEWMTELHDMTDELWGQEPSKYL